MSLSEGGDICRPFCTHNKFDSTPDATSIHQDLRCACASINMAEVIIGVRRSPSGQLRENAICAHGHETSVVENGLVDGAMMQL